MQQHVAVNIAVAGAVFTFVVTATAVVNAVVTAAALATTCVTADVAAAAAAVKMVVAAAVIVSIVATAAAVKIVVAAAVVVSIIVTAAVLLSLSFILSSVVVSCVLCNLYSALLLSVESTEQHRVVCYALTSSSRNQIVTDCRLCQAGFAKPHVT